MPNHKYPPNKLFLKDNFLTCPESYNNRALFAELLRRVVCLFTWKIFIFIVLGMEIAWNQEKRLGNLRKHGLGLC